MGSILYVEGQIVFLTESEVKILAKGRPIESCGRVAFIDRSDRYKGKDLKDFDLGKEIEMLTEWSKESP
jgi:hypothetical protein